MEFRQKLADFGIVAGIDTDIIAYTYEKVNYQQPPKGMMPGAARHHSFRRLLRNRRMINKENALHQG
jgi:hypothetical protein